MRPERSSASGPSEPERCSRGLGGTGHRPVAAGDSPAALGAPGMHSSVFAMAVPKLGGKLPPRTAKLAVPPGSNRMVPAESLFEKAGRPRRTGFQPVCLRASSPLHHLSGVGLEAPEQTGQRHCPTFRTGSEALALGANAGAPVNPVMPLTTARSRSPAAPTAASSPRPHPAPTPSATSRRPVEGPADVPTSQDR